MPAANNTRHGHTVNGRASPTYLSWQSMWQRCTNPKKNTYPYYGGRGIKVCDRWRKFDNFLKDMGERPPETTLDRYPDKNGNYNPGNCRWASKTAQTQNRRPSKEITTSRRMIEAFGETKTMRQWSRDPRCSVSYVTLQARINQLNWPHETAISGPKCN